MDGIGYIPRSVAAGTLAVAVRGSKRLQPTQRLQRIEPHRVLAQALVCSVRRRIRLFDLAERQCHPGITLWDVKRWRPGLRVEVLAFLVAEQPEVTGPALVGVGPAREVAFDDSRDCPFDVGYGRSDCVLVDGHLHTLAVLEQVHGSAIGLRRSSSSIRASGPSVLRWEFVGDMRRSGAPGVSGRMGAVRSSAWIWVFSSSHSTTAACGGFKYSPAMSRTLSTNWGHWTP